jgi:hypothetical protein
MADDYHEYLDDAPDSRMARLIASGAHPDSLARKMARQNAAELAALPDGTGPEHIRAFAASARAYAQRVPAMWSMPHHQYRGAVVTVGGMVGAASAEWHLHAWDLARTLGKEYSPADPDVLAAGWQAGLPHIPLDLPASPAVARHPAASCAVVPGGTAVRGTAVGGTAERGGSGRRGNVVVGVGPAAVEDSPAWIALLRASGRLP